MTRSRLSSCLRNGNRNLQHAIADRQSNFQACSFNHSDISPFRINSLRAVADQITRNGLDVLAFYDHVWIQWLRDVEEQLVAEIV